VEEDTSEKDVVFNILSHPLRRKILVEIYSNHTISYLTLSKEWKVSDGSIYHHLKILDAYLSQNEGSQYILNEEGIQLCERYLMDDERRHKIERINIFTVYTYQIINFLEKYRKLTTAVALILSVAGIITSEYLNIFVIGPFLFKAPEGQKNLLLLNLLSNLVLLSLLFASSYLTDFTFDGKLEILHGYLVSIQPSFLLIIVLGFLYLINPFTISVVLWIVFDLVLQLIFLLLNVSLLIVHKKASAERSILINIAILYFIVILLSRLF
jgi:hypothetical protein